jgi:hypothetical protein
MDGFFNAFDACLLALAQGACWVEALFLISTCTPFVAPLFIRCFCCGIPCSVALDNFGTDLLATDYTIISGSWTVSGGRLRISDYGAMILHNSQMTGGAGRITVTSQVDAVGVNVRVIAAYEDSSNYIYAECERTGATDSNWKLYEVVAGVATQVGTTYNDAATGLNTNLIASVCWSANNANLFTGGTLRIFADTTVNGNQCGVGADAAAGEAEFDAFTLANAFEITGVVAGCVRCTPSCVDSTMRSQVQMDVAGITNGTCGSCTSLNNTYILDMSPNTFSNFTYIDTFGTICATSQVTWSYNTDGGVALLSNGQYAVTGLGGNNLDCSAVVGPIDNTLGDFFGDCNLSGGPSTVTITPL